MAQRLLKAVRYLANNHSGDETTMRFPNFDQETGESFAQAETALFEDESGFTSEDEVEETELAVELLGVSSEEELDHFLGGLISKAIGAGASFLRSTAGQQLGGLLKSAAKKALPMLGRAVGGYFGGTSGARLGGTLAANAGKIFGLETEGLSNEDRDYEIARQYVRFARDAARRVRASGKQRHGVRRAYDEAARRHAPGLMAPMQPAPAQGFADNGFPYQGSALPDYPVSGRWMRRGNTLVLM